jgi:hypothetical protein
MPQVEAPAEIRLHPLWLPTLSQYQPFHQCIHVKRQYHEIHAYDSAGITMPHDLCNSKEIFTAAQCIG